MHRWPILMIVAVVSCGGGEDAEESVYGERFVKSLEELGYFDYVDTESVPGVRDRIRSAGWDGLFEEVNRLYRADAEDLAEGGVEPFLRTVEPFLQRQQVVLASVESSFGEDSYVVAVTGRQYPIWQAADIERARSDLGWIWGVTSVRTLELLNTLLEEAGSSERAYAVNGGNDLFVFFLTEPLHRLIATHPGASRPDSPYGMVEEYPWFGQPH